MSNMFAVVLRIRLRGPAAGVTECHPVPLVNLAASIIKWNLSVMI